MHRPQRTFVAGFTLLEKCLRQARRRARRRAAPATPPYNHFRLSISRISRCEEEPNGIQYTRARAR